MRAAPLAQGRARYPLSKETPPLSRQWRRLEQSPPTQAPRGARGLAPGRSGIAARRPRPGTASPASGCERCGRQSRRVIARSAGPVGGDGTRRAWAQRPPWDRSRSGRQNLRALGRPRRWKLEVPGTLLLARVCECAARVSAVRWGRIDCSYVVVLYGLLLRS